MPTTVERVVTVPATREAVWALVADPETRARTIGVVDSYDIHDDNRSVWHVDNPLLPGGATLAIEISEQRRDRPEVVEYEGTSKAFDLTGRHELVTVDGGCQVTSEFDVDQHIPGVEEYFQEQLDAELRRLEQAIFEATGQTQEGAR